MPSFEAALEYAGKLFSDNCANVAIDDGKGDQISGDDLIALSWRDEIDTRPARGR